MAVFLNYVHEYVNINFVINLTVTVFNLFNNLDGNPTFTRCKFYDDGTKEVAVFVLLGGKLVLNDCELIGFTGPSKDFILATSDVALDITFNNTPLPDTATCLFKFTDPTPGTINVLGASTSKSSILANCTGNFSIVFHQLLDDHSNVVINNPETTHTLMYDGNDNRWENRK